MDRRPPEVVGCGPGVNGDVPKRSSIEMTMKGLTMAGTTEHRSSDDDAVRKKYSLEDFEIKNALGKTRNNNNSNNRPTNKTY